MTKATTAPKTKAKTKLLPFDAARYLTDDAAVAEYMTAVLETEDADLLLLALGDVAKPRFDTVIKVAKALGVRLTAQTV
jgi:DNA-binding phage protein